MIQLVQSQAFRNAPINFVGVINECITALLLPCSLQLGFFFFFLLIKMSCSIVYTNSVST